MEKKFNTKITEMLGIEHPILCGGMQWVSKAEFVSHVCNAGGLGFITAESFEEPKDLKEEIKKMRDLTDKPFGINLSMIPELGMPERTLRFCDIVCEEGIKVVETAGRSPEPLMPKLKAAGVKVIHKLTSIRHAESAEKLGVDGIALLGYGSGGHIGMENIANFISVPIAIKRLKVPVIVGGGVSTGAGLLAALSMGAEAVLMGTAFFVTEESPIHSNIKKRIFQANVKDTTLVMKSIRNPMRVLKNKLSETVIAMEEKGATLEEIIVQLAGGKGKLAYDNGDTDISPIACGQIIGMIDEIKTVKQVIDSIISEAGELYHRLESIYS